MRLSKSRPSHWSQVSNRFIYGDQGPKKLDPPTEASSSPSDNSRNSAFAAMKACSSSGDISTPNSAHASRNSSIVWIRAVRSIISCSVAAMMITPFSSDRASRPVSANQYGNRFCRPQAAANERPITANERSCMEPNEAGQMGVRGRSFRSKKNVPMPRAPNARIAQCRGADGEIIEGSRGAAMVASFATTATMNTDQGISSFSPDFAQICVENGSERKKGRKRFQLPTCKLLVAGAGFEPTASGL